MWYDNVVLEPDYHFISSRVRIVRNLDNYVFPGKLDMIEIGRASCRERV